MKLETTNIREKQEEPTTYLPWNWVIGFFVLVMASVATAEWQFDPILRVGWDHNDNASMSHRTDGEQEISGLVAEASVDIRSDSETSYISLRPMVRTRNYEDLYNLDSDDAFLRLRWGLDGEKHMVRSVVSYDSESVRTAELGGEDFDFESDPGDLADDDTGRIGLQQHRERLRILPRWTYRFSDVSSIVTETNFLNVTYSDQPAETNLFDYRDARVAFSYKHALSQTNTGILSLTGRDYQTDNVNRNDASGYGITAGFTRQWSETTQLRALLGVEQTEIDDPSAEQEDLDPNFVTEVSLLRQLETTRLLAQYRQRIIASGRGGLRRRSEANLSLARDLNDKISAGIGFRAYTIDALEGSGKEQDYVQLRGQFVWRITSALSIQATYIHTLLDRRDIGESSNANHLTLWFSYQPTPRGPVRPASVL